MKNKVNIFIEQCNPMKICVEKCMLRAAGFTFHLNLYEWKKQVCRARASRHDS
jgi:hypothetical protein